MIKYIIAILLSFCMQAQAQETYLRIIQLGAGSTQFGRNIAPPGAGKSCILYFNGDIIAPADTPRPGCLVMGTGLSIDPITGYLTAAGSPGATGPKGDTGAPGQKGDTGASVTGPAGPANSISIGSVSTLSPGSAASAVLSGTSPNQTLSLGIPAGSNGVGSPGPANTVSIGTVTSLPAGSAATATITGTAPNQTLNLGIPVGLTGSAGANGTNGSAGPAGSLPAAVITSVTKALNTCFQPSATRNAVANYNVDIVASLSVAGGQRGTIYLETFTDSACSTGASEVMHSTNGNTSGLALAIGNVSTQTLNVHGWIAAGLWVKLRSENNVGVPTYTPAKGQEVLQ